LLAKERSTRELSGGEKGKKYGRPGSARTTSRGREMRGRIKEGKEKKKAKLVQKGGRGRRGKKGVINVGEGEGTAEKGSTNLQKGEGGGRGEEVMRRFEKQNRRKRPCIARCRNQFLEPEGKNDRYHR